MNLRICRSACIVFLACSLLLVVGCNKVNQDTPQATIASLIKLYAAKDASHWTTLVEPTVTRMDARGVACLDVTIRDFQCTEALLKNGVRGHIPSWCPVKVADCTCGERGNAAATKASDFAASDANAGLGAMGLSVESCHITDSKELTKEGLSDAGFWDFACSDIAKEDQLVSVTVACSLATDPLVFILHKKGATWMVAGFSNRTNATLLASAESARNATAAKKRATDLNKDMK